MSPDSLDGLERIVELADRFESDWRQGSYPRIEDFMGAFTGPHRPALLHNLMRIELEIRRKRGDSPRLEEYLERFPLDREVVVNGFADRSGEAGWTVAMRLSPVLDHADRPGLPRRSPPGIGRV